MRMRDKINRSIKYKFRLIFLISIITGNCISIYIVAPFVKQKVVDIYTDKYNTIIAKLYESKDDKDKFNEYIDIYNDFGYEITNISNIDEFKLNENQVEKLKKNNSLVFFSAKKHQISAIMIANNDYIIISEDSSHNINFIPILLNLWVFIVTISISYIIINFVSKKLIFPIEELAQASNKIAEGDFDIEVKSRYRDEDELGKLIDNFNTMANELKNLDYMQKDFINNVSHEFKTPIAAVKGYLTILKNERLAQDERLEYINIVLDEMSRLSNLSTNILELSKLDNMDNFKDKEKFSLDEQIRKTVILLEKEWSKKNINFNLDLPSTYYYGKEEYLKQVWLNIINNAIKFSYENGLINIYLKKSANEVTVVIEDFGCGMDEKTKKYLFNRFYQGDDSRSESGYGLGLAISEKIVELSKGSIIVESEVDKYTRFIVKLPF